MNLLSADGKCCCIRIELGNPVDETFRLTDQNGDPVDGSDIEVTVYVVTTGEPLSGVTWPVGLVGQGGGLYRLQFSTENVTAGSPTRFRAVFVGTVPISFRAQCESTIRLRPIPCEVP